MTTPELKQSGLEDYFKAKFLLHFFLLSTLIDGAICDRNQSKTYEMKILTEKRVDNPEQPYKASLRNENKTISNENVLVGIDKMLHWIFDNELEKANKSCRKKRKLKFKLGDRFTFRRRLHFALLPIMYKMGVMTTLLTGLTVLALKGLTIGVILLIFAFGNHFTKWHKYPHHSPQPIHVHVHSQDGQNKISSFPMYASEPINYADDRLEENYDSPLVKCCFNRRPTLQTT